MQNRRRRRRARSRSRISVTVLRVSVCPCPCVGASVCLAGRVQSSAGQLWLALPALGPETCGRYDGEQGKIHHGLWTYYKGPPFLNRVTMYAGNDVDLTRSGEIVRRVVGLPKNFGKWEGNTYLQDFDSQQMRFIQSNKHSVRVHPAPPMPSSRKPPPPASGHTHKPLCMALVPPSGKYWIQTRA